MISEQLDAITGRVNNEFGGLSTQLLNKQPAPDKWSIAQCLDHLIVSNQTYLPAFERLLTAGHKPTFWEKINPLTNFIGKKGPEFLKGKKIKLKSPKIFAPATGFVMGDIVSRFVDHQEQLKSLFARIEQAGHADSVISSPVSSLVNIKAGAAMEIIAAHEARHLDQATGVKRDIMNK